jgi:hypothetical protein
MRKLPLAQHAIRQIDGDGRLVLRFDDPAGSTLLIEGSFTLRSGDWEDVYEPPCQEWVRDVLSGLISVRVAEARYSRHGDLMLSFEDGRVLHVKDGPFENWQYSNVHGERAVGGVGRVVTWGLQPGRNL